MIQRGSLSALAGLVSLALAIGSCGGDVATTTSSAPSTSTTIAPTTTSSVAMTPATTTPPTIPLPPLPDLHGDLAWFAPLPPLSTNPGRPFIGSADFMDLFASGSPWDTAASHLQVFKLYGEWVAYGATDDELRTAVAAIAARGLALAVEAGPLDPPEDCGQGIEGFAGTDEGRLIAQRILTAGGTLDLIALDEPYYYASIYDGPNACHWAADTVAAAVDEYISVMRGYFPNVIVGDTEPTPYPVEANTYTDWLETFRDVNGYDLAFLHLDIDWSRTDWPTMVGEVTAFGEGFGVPIGIIYIGNGADPSDEIYISITGERILRLEDEFGVTPPHVLFQSWVDHPDRVLPESDPSSFTGLIRAYFEDRSSLGFRTEGPGANVALHKEAGASNTELGRPAGLAFDGDIGTLWSAGAFPAQWIEVDLGQPFDVSEIRLIPSQYPEGRTVHTVLGRGPDTGGFVVLGVLDGDTVDGELLTIAADIPWLALDTIRVETSLGESWVAWREISVIEAGATGNGD